MGKNFLKKVYFIVKSCDKFKIISIDIDFFIIIKYNKINNLKIFNYIWIQSTRVYLIKC